MLNFFKKRKKKVYEKWFIFFIATFTVTCGIVSELFKGTSASTEVPANSAFDDINFYKCVVDAYNSTNGTSVAYTTSLTDAQLKTIRDLKCDGSKKTDDEKIVSAKGVEKLINIQLFWINNNNLTDIDVSKNILLINFQIDQNQLTQLDVSKNVRLNYLSIDSNQLTTIDVSGNTNLYGLSVAGNQLTALNVTKNTLLTDLNVGGNRLTSLDVSNNINLNVLYVSNNQLTSLDLSKHTKLNRLEADKNQLTSLDVSNTNLSYFFASDNKLTSLKMGTLSTLSEIRLNNNNLKSIDISKNTNLRGLNVPNNQLTTLDISKNTSLLGLDVSNNKLTTLNVSNNINLSGFHVSNNQLTTLNLSNNINLSSLDVSNNKLTTLNLNKNTKLSVLKVSNNQLTTLDLTANIGLKNLYVSGNKLTKLDLSKNTALTYVTFNDNLFGVTCNLYVGSKCTLNDNLTLPSQLISSSDTWLTVSSNIASVDNSGLVIAKSPGQTVIKRKYSKIYMDYDNTINVYQIKSSKYIIDEENGYILAFDNDVETLKSNISVTTGGTLVVDLSNKKLYVKVDNKTIKEFKLIIATSNVYDLTSDYIFLGTSKFSSSNISITNNGSISNSGNKLIIKGGTVVLKEITLASISSSVYDLNKDYIYTGTNKFSSSNITCVNCTVSIASNNILIRNDYVTIKEYAILKISSSTYDLSKDYIYVGTGQVDTNKISASSGVEKIVENNKLLLKYKGDLLDEFNILSVSSEKYDLSKDYIYVGNSKIDTNNIVVSGGIDKVIENNKLLIKYDGNLLDEYDIISISSTVYDLNKDYIYTGINEFSSSDITCVNCTVSSTSSKVLIKNGSVTIKEYVLLKISSSTYDLLKDYIYVGTAQLNTSKISVSSGITKSVENNKLFIKYNEILLDEFDIVSISSEKYNLSKDYIYVGFDEFDVNEIKCVNCVVTEVDNNLSIKYDTIEVKQIPIIKITSNGYSITDDSICIKKDSVDYSEFILNVVSNREDVTYKIYKGIQEINDSVTGGMILKIYYNNVLIDQYDIVSEYIDFADDLLVSNKVVGNVRLGSLFVDLLDKIDTNGVVSVYDKNDSLITDNSVKIKTGDKFRFDFTNKIVIYKISVNGDVDGNGIVNMNDIILSSNHIVSGNQIVGDEYIKASDFDNNEKTNINDIIKMKRYINDNVD